MMSADQISQTGTYQSLSSTGIRSFDIQITLPVPIAIFKYSRFSKADSLVTGFNTLKFLIAIFPGDADFLISIGESTPF